MFFSRQKLDFQLYCFFKIFFQVSFFTVFIFVATVIFTRIAKFDRFMNMFILTKNSKILYKNIWNKTTEKLFFVKITKWKLVNVSL